MTSDLPERLRSLATSLEGDEWEHPLNSQETCRIAAEEIEKLRDAMQRAARLLSVCSFDNPLDIEDCDVVFDITDTLS
jgi:hypothetical protein